MDYLVHPDMSEEIDNHGVEGIHRMKIPPPLCALCGLCGSFYFWKFFLYKKNFKRDHTSKKILNRF